MKRWRKPLLPSDALQRCQFTSVFHTTPSMHRGDNFQGLGVIRPSVIQKCASLCIRPPILPSEGTPGSRHCGPLPAPKFHPSRRFVSHSHRQVGPVNQSSMTFDQFQIETASQRNPPQISSPGCISAQFSTQQAAHSRQRFVAYGLCLEHASPVLQILQQSMCAESIRKY